MSIIGVIGVVAGVAGVGVAVWIAILANGNTP